MNFYFHPDLLRKAFGRVVLIDPYDNTHVTLSLFNYLLGCLLNLYPRRNT